MLEIKPRERESILVFLCLSQFHCLQGISEEAKCIPIKSHYLEETQHLTEANLSPIATNSKIKVTNPQNTKTRTEILTLLASIVPIQLPFSSTLEALRK